MQFITFCVTWPITSSWCNSIKMMLKTISPLACLVNILILQLCSETVHKGSFLGWLAAEAVFKKESSEIGFSPSCCADTNPSVSCGVVVPCWWNGQLKPGMTDLDPARFGLFSLTECQRAAEGSESWTQLDKYLRFNLFFLFETAPLFWIFWKGEVKQKQIILFRWESGMWWGLVSPGQVMICALNLSASCCEAV